MGSVQEALALMKTKGYKITPKRQAMLEIIAEKQTFVSAKQVQELLKQQYLGLSYDTVYRNLYMFVEQGILEMSERHGEKVFLMHCKSHGHHHHFICQHCQRITEIHMCPMDSFQEQLPGYRILGHHFEIVGICSECLGNTSVQDYQYKEAENCKCGHHEHY